MHEHARTERLTLDGEWQISLGGQVGAIRVPGAWEVQGYPDTEGPAIYRRTFTLPAHWHDERIEIQFGAVSYYVEAYINGVRVGEHEGLWTPFAFDITDAARSGAENEIVLHITKPADEGDRFPYREVLVGFIPYVATTFGGVWQSVELIVRRDDQPRAPADRPLTPRLQVEGERLLLDGQPIILRGILSWGWDENTLAPTPTDEQIRAEFRRVRALGFNLYKLCLYVPPPNVFRIADEEGMLLWLELPLWLPRLNDHLRAQTVREFSAILDRVQQHRSIVIVSLGCELSADQADADLLERLNTIARTKMPGALICDNSGSGEAYGGLTHDYADFNDYHFYADLHHFDPLCDHFRRDWRAQRPTIFGEFCDKDDYRDPTELPQAWWRALVGKDGGIHRWAYPEQAQRVDALGLPFDHQQIMQIARRESFLMRKVILEKCRARHDIGGYVITGLRDTPITTSGMFDDLGRFKFDEAAFVAFNAERVLLIDTPRARHWTHGGDRPASIDKFNYWAGAVAQFSVILAGELSLYEETLRWALTDATGQLIMGAAAPLEPTIKLAPRELAALMLPLPAVEQPTAYTLALELGGGSADQALSNAWTLWVYPPVTFADAVLYDPAGALSDYAPITRITTLDDAGDRVVITSAYTLEIADYLHVGGRVIVVQVGDGALPVLRVPFWRESIKLLYDHPVLNGFPHAGHADLQFYHLATDAAFDPMGVETRIGTPLTPIMRRLDARLFTVSEYLAAAQVGTGRLVITTLRLAGGAGDQVSGLAHSPAGSALLARLIAHARA